MCLGTVDLADLRPAAQEAARALGCGMPAGPQGAALLAALGYGQSEAGQRQHRVAMLRAAAGLQRLFVMQPPDAPCAVAVGGETGGENSASVSGLGATLREAFESCVGEAIEHVSICTCSEGRSVDLPWPVSSGCAAAPDAAMAASLALLELIERDAAALWWYAGRPARILAAESEAVSEAAALLKILRGTPSARTTWLLDITSDIAVPVIAAISCGADGFGVCCGTAARPTRRAAARRAVLEMCQMELGAHLATILRDAFGQAALRADALRHVRRIAEIDAASCPALRAAPPPSQIVDVPPLGPSALRDRLCGHVRQAGFETAFLDLTRAEIGVPVMRALSPGLQAAARPPVTARLAQAAARHGRILEPWPASPML